MTDARPAPSRTSRARLFADAGEMGRRIAEYDWPTSLLGPIEDWPEALVNAASLMLPAGAEIVLFWGPDFVALYNDAYAPTIGNKHPRALGCAARECWSELWDDLEPLLSHVRDTGETYSARDRPFYIEREGYGEEVYFDVSYSAVRLADGSVGGVLCIVSETTARVRAGRAIAEDRARLATMFDSAPSFMAVLRQPGHVFELANASFLKLIGPRELIGLSLAEALPEIAGQGFVRLLDEVVRSGRPHREERARVRLQRTPGGDPEMRTIDFVYQPLTDIDGRVTGIFVEGIDITEREARADALRESEARFRDLADSAPALIWLTDGDGRIRFTNRWFQSLLGVTADEMQAGGWLRLIPTEDRARIGKYGADARKGRHAFGGELRVVDAAGKDHWVHAEAKPRFHAGQFQGYVGVAIDVTEAHVAADALEQRVAARTAELADANRLLTEQIAERERVETTLQQMQRLEAVGQLTAGVAHDFNNLLTVVLGNVEMLQRGAAKGGALDDRAARRLEHIRAAAERGASLTAQLLAFARRAKLEARAVDLNATVEGMRGLLESSLGGTITIATRLDPNVWPALVDPTQFELIILNLAINARDAMARGGTVMIETANVSLDMPERAEEPAAGDYVMVAVSDEGSGMPPDVFARVFEPFFTTKGVGKGSGLGLAQVYGFAKQSGGGVRIDTRVDEGTVVRVYLPRSDRAEVEETTAAPRPETFASIDRRTILVLDDDDAVRGVTADSLREAGWRVIEAADGASALDALGAEPEIALVVADFAMPEMNGAEFAGQARVRHPALPIVFVTGYADLAALAEVGEDAILQKPYRVEDLVTRVRLALGSEG